MSFISILYVYFYDFDLFSDSVSHSLGLSFCDMQGQMCVCVCDWMTKEFHFDDWIKFNNNNNWDMGLNFNSKFFTCPEKAIGEQKKL